MVSTIQFINQSINTFKRKSDTKRWLIIFVRTIRWFSGCIGRKLSWCPSFFNIVRNWCNCIALIYNGLFIIIHCTVSKHAGCVNDPSYVTNCFRSGNNSFSCNRFNCWISPLKFNEKKIVKSQSIDSNGKIWVKNFSEITQIEIRLRLSWFLLLYKQREKTNQEDGWKRKTKKKNTQKRNVIKNRSYGFVFSHSLIQEYSSISNISHNNNHSSLVYYKDN